MKIVITEAQIKEAKIYADEVTKSVTQLVATSDGANLLYCAVNPAGHVEYKIYKSYNSNFKLVAHITYCYSY